MKKEDCDISVCTVALGGLLIGIVVLYFAGKLLGYTDASPFLKDHGSLIAGLLGFGGIFILVWNQNKSTQKTVDATLRAIRLDSFEIRKREHLEDLVDIYTLIDSAELTSDGVSMGVITSIRVKMHRLVLFRHKAVEGRIFLLETYFVFLDALDHLVVNPQKIIRRKSDFLTIERLRTDFLKALELTKQELDAQLAWSEHRKLCIDTLTRTFQGEIELNKIAEIRNAESRDFMEFYEGVSEKYRLEVSMVIHFLKPFLRSVIDHISSLKAEDNA